MTPKPMYHELKKLIKGKWWTTTAVETGRDGKAALRGFLGDYKITVTVGSKSTVREFSLAKDQKSTWEVKMD